MDQLKANLITQYMIFVHDFADPSEVSKKEIEAKIKCDVKDLFSRQRLADLAKKELGEDFKKAVALYFDRYQSKDGVNHLLLSRALERDEAALTLHLKKDAVRYLKLIAEVLSHVDKGPKGLLV